ncbi:unnamed protein product, partial [Sphacelaria rigidula]
MRKVTHRRDATRTPHRAQENDWPSKQSTRRRTFTKDLGVDAEQKEQEGREEDEACRLGSGEGKRSRGRRFPFADELVSVFYREEQEEKGEEEAEPETENGRNPRESREAKSKRGWNPGARAEGYVVV